MPLVHIWGEAPHMDLNLAPLWRGFLLGAMDAPDRACPRVDLAGAGALLDIKPCL